MKYLLTFLVFTSITGAIYGFSIKAEDPENGHLFIGLSVVLLFFIVMPVFIYHRWKNRSVKDYMLTKESIGRMKEFSNEKKL